MAKKSKKLEDVVVEAKADIDESGAVEMTHKAFGWYKKKDNTFALVTISYNAEAGKAEIKEVRNTGGLRGKVMIEFHKLLFKNDLVGGM